jgi:hypothetical protein
MIVIRPHRTSGLRGYYFWVRKLRGIFEFYLNRVGRPGSPYNHPISPRCGIYLLLKEGAEGSCLGQGEENLSF